ncbi:glutathione S-transferase family protein [Rhizobium sp. LjRoot258]|jgi:glutathione S-transferase|uniref:glutathione S-transferase family protein n=1 Tax=Rhizobium sp. LjRoot258 TaxID=3342299 RepID=UPI003F4F9D62
MRLDPTKGQSKTPEYLALNPRGKVQTLTNGEFVVRESIAIMAYLEREMPDPALRRCSQRRSR